jgi:hypothetical protein
MKKFNAQTLLLLVKSARVEEVIQNYSEQDYVQSDGIKRLDSQRDTDYADSYPIIQALYGKHKPEKCLLRCSSSDGEIYIYHFGLRYHIFKDLKTKQKN